MIRRSTRMFAFALLCAAIADGMAAQYQLNGTVYDQGTNPVIAEIDVTVTSNTATSRLTTATASNGTYSASVTASSGDSATVSAQRIAPYAWVRELTLGSTTNIQNFNFFIPEVNMTKTSVVGAVSIQGRMPSESSAIALTKTDQVNSQTLVAARLVALGGFSATNTYEFLDLPTGNYTVNAHADSSGWTQMVISVTSSNTPLRLDINF